MTLKDQVCYLTSGW